MKTYHKLIIAFVIIALCVLLYVSKKNKEAQMYSYQATTTDVIIKESTEFYDISAVYPRELWDKEFIIEKDVLTIVNQTKEDWKVNGGVYTEEKSIREAFPDRPLVKYELNIDYEKFESKDMEMVSYVFTNYYYTGGAHGGSGIATYTFDKNGQVQIGDILNLNGPNSLALSILLRDKLRKSLGESYNAEMLDGGLGLQYIKNNVAPSTVENDTFNFALNFKNFVVFDEGIKFIFGQYQIAPYSLGISEVVLTWDELKPYVKN